MKIHRNLDEWKVMRPVITTGIFDGVHLGHSSIIRRVVELAGETGGESVVLTFWPHPRTILGEAGPEIRYLTTIEEKGMILERYGISHMVVLPFDRDLAGLPACGFVEKYLVRMGIRHLVVGYNHHFGKDREGDFETITRCGAEFSFGVERIGPVLLEGEEISSSMIREALDKGDIRLANQMLGYSYFFHGIVVGGTRLGRKIGFPTANIQPVGRMKSIPCEGVYAVMISIDGERLSGMMNIGTRPTVSSQNNNTSIEVHIFDFERNIYNQGVTIHILARIRDEVRFESMDSLKEQLEEDKRVALAIIGELS